MKGKQRKRPDAKVAPLRRRAPRRGAASNAHGSFPVVAVGASAGGLDALQKFFDATPPDSGMGFVVIQHLDPTHPSMMVELLAGHTAMKVQQAVDGMRIERDCIYVIPPGVFLSTHAGALRLSKPPERHGTRLPFDFLLRSLAQDFGERAICVVLSGTGADGSLGLRAVKEEGGLVIAQDPDEAEHDGMPRNAVATGGVSLVLPVAKIPGALLGYHRRLTGIRTQSGSNAEEATQSWLPGVIELLRTKTPHDFTHYKPGTLQRRIERRLAMAEINTDSMARYLEVLQSDATELDLLVQDLLINVTSFFRDSHVFERLSEEIIPRLLGSLTSDRALRIWVAGCSTGEEAYSFAMLAHEQIAATKRHVKLQIFASDVDADAVAKAREGLYPESIEAEVSPQRLARFFTREGRSYRIVPEIRGAVVFTVQDVLSDPPFSHLDLISCRNLLIYLRPEAQAKVISLFHFALREDGILLLGTSETVGNADDRFEMIAKPERIFRHIGRSRPGDLDRTMAPAAARMPVLPDRDHGHSRQAELADLCRRLVTETHAPATVLINRDHECLYSLGPTDRYLQVATGHATRDVFAMAREGVRTKLRTVVQRAGQENARAVVSGIRMSHGDKELSFAIDAQPVLYDGENLLLISFVDEPKRERKPDRPLTQQESSQVAEIEQELKATKIELEDAIRNLELQTAAQKMVSEEALSVSEEYQATNEELLTSKEELQSLNEELTALNSQLQETLEQQRTTSNDLQNVLNSTDVATIFLDTGLNIRFFTPATTSLFSVIPTDVGRPLADINSLAADSALLEDARTVLRTLVPIEQEIMTRSGSWYVRRVLPYRVRDNGVEGVVITFVDITERKRTADSLAEAERQAKLANEAKSRFLAAASHDLRQPLQTIFLLHGLLATAIEGGKAQNLVARLYDAATSMSGMLNALLDINQIEAGTIRTEIVDFPVDELLDRLGDEFSYHAHAQGLTLRVVSCGLSIRSDPRLLEQMIRNLLSNALKYTTRGKVLLGCRRREGMLSIEVWDTGVGIPDAAYETIFEDYEQLDNAARERERGFGLGLSIVRRLGNMLGHRVRVLSRPGEGSVFAVEVMLAPEGTQGTRGSPRSEVDERTSEGLHLSGTFLVVEDDPDVRELLKLFLEGEGHRAVTAPDGPAALELMTGEDIHPDVLLADYNLPNGMNGLQVAERLRDRLHREIPTIILTGDISAATLRDVARQNCVQINKPIKADHLVRVARQLLESAPSPHAHAPRPGEPETGGGPERPIVYIIDDDSHLCDEYRNVLEEDGLTVETFPTAEAFLDAYRPGREACLLVDAHLPGMGGLDVLERVRDGDDRLTSIMITGNGDVPMAIAAMKAGASDFFEKPVDTDHLLSGVRSALERSRDASKQATWHEEAANRIAVLTPRQRQIMDLILAGQPNKIIAADLGISQRTVENHRAAILRGTGSKSLPALARLALAATLRDGGGPPDRS